MSDRSCHLSENALGQRLHRAPFARGAVLVAEQVQGAVDELVADMGHSDSHNYYTAQARAHARTHARTHAHTHANSP